MSLVKEIQKIADKHGLVVFPQDLEGETMSLRVVKSNKWHTVSVNESDQQTAESELLRKLRELAEG